MKRTNGKFKACESKNKPIWTITMLQTTNIGNDEESSEDVTPSKYSKTYHNADDACNDAEDLVEEYKDMEGYYLVEVWEGGYESPDGEILGSEYMYDIFSMLTGTQGYQGHIMLNEQTWVFSPRGHEGENWMGGINQDGLNFMNARKFVQKQVRNGKLDIKTIPFSTTNHMNSRNDRRNAIIRDGGGFGDEALAVFFVDKHHKDGSELHWITDNGFIIITNASRMNGLDVCTNFLGRPGQLIRYQNGWQNCKQVYPTRPWRVPSDVLDKAKQHQQDELNVAESVNTHEAEKWHTLKINEGVDDWIDLHQ